MSPNQEELHIITDYFRSVSFNKGVLEQFQCSHCEIAYSRKTLLNKHVEETHRVIMRTSEDV